MLGASLDECKVILCIRQTLSDARLTPPEGSAHRRAGSEGVVWEWSGSGLGAGGSRCTAKARQCLDFRSCRQTQFATLFKRIHIRVWEYGDR